MLESLFQLSFGGRTFGLGIFHVRHRPFVTEPRCINKCQLLGLTDTPVLSRTGRKNSILLCCNSTVNNSGVLVVIFEKRTDQLTTCDSSVETFGVLGILRTKTLGNTIRWPGNVSCRLIGGGGRPLGILKRQSILSHHRFSGIRFAMILQRSRRKNHYPIAKPSKTIIPKNRQNQLSK